MFAEIALPLNVSQTFTYRLPEHMAEAARPGSRVIVPFGKKLQAAFIVRIHEDIDDELRGAIKEVAELIDETPVVNGDILELTKWMADYYYAPWGECLRSALPAGTLAATEKLVTITDAGRTAAADPGTGRTAAAGLGASRRTTKDAALELLSKSGTMSSRELEQQAPKLGTKPAAIQALMRRLERAGYVRITQRVGESRLRPRLQNVVRLISRTGVSEVQTSDSRHPEEDPESPLQGAGNCGDAENTQTRLEAVDGPPGELHSGPPRRGRRKSATNTGKRASDGGKRLTEQQQRVVDQLAYKGQPVPLGELLEAAGTSASAVRTLEKRGIVEVFAREIRRDPLAHIEVGP